MALGDLPPLEGVGLSKFVTDQVQGTEMLLLRRQQAWFPASLLQSPDWIAELSVAASESHENDQLWTFDEGDPLSPPVLDPSEVLDASPSPSTTSLPSFVPTPSTRKARSKVPAVDATLVSSTDEKKLTIQSTVLVMEGDIRRSGSVSSLCLLIHSFC